MFDELAEGVFRRRYQSLDLNVGVVVSTSGVLVVDTRASHIEAGELSEEISALTALPIRWAVNTDWHWDHTFGNAVFGAAEIWGHRRCREVMEESGDLMKSGAIEWLPDLREDIEAVRVTPPGRVFVDSTTLDLGSHQVTLTYHGLGHSDADIVVEVGGVRFMGDLLEEGAPPAFDDAYPLNWPDTLASALADPASTLVPGHGDVMDEAAARTQLEELVEVSELARRCLDGEIVVDDAIALGPYPEPTMRTALDRARLVAS